MIKKQEKLIKERPLKGLKEMIRKNKVMFKENSNLNHLSQEKLKEFKDMRKWDAELEKLDREEIGIKNSLKEINLKIIDAMNKKHGKSSSYINQPSERLEKYKIDTSLSKIGNAIKRAKEDKKNIFEKIIVTKG